MRYIHVHVHVVIQLSSTVSALQMYSECITFRGYRVVIKPEVSIMHSIKGGLKF